MPKILTALNVVLLLFAFILLAFGLINAQASCSRLYSLGCLNGAPGFFKEALSDVLGVIYTVSGLSVLCVSYALRRG